MLYINTYTQKGYIKRRDFTLEKMPMNRLSILSRILDYPRYLKVSIMIMADYLSLLSSLVLTILFANKSFFFFDLIEIIGLFSIPLVSLAVFVLLRVYKSMVRFINFNGLITICVGISLSTIILMMCRYLFIGILYFTPITSLLTVSDILIYSAFSFVLILGSRLLAYSLFDNTNGAKKIAIYGAGSAGVQLASALRLSKEMNPTCFVDDNKMLHGTLIGNLKVLSRKKLLRRIQKGKVDEVLIAIPSASRMRLKSLLEEIEGTSVRVRILPGVSELAQGKILVKELKEVALENLLGRNEISPNLHLLQKNIKGKNVLITGAGGSIGSEISRQVAKNDPKKLILLDSNEYALYLVKNEIEELESKIDIVGVIGSVTNKKRIQEVCSSFNVQTIYHSAAYKHVSLVEENPFEAVSNNIYGTKICAESAAETGVETFVLISTDKAVRPTNIMGATKRFAELILQSMALTSKTNMTIVRFGNVIGSSGSAIPLFQKQIKNGGPVTVTDPDVIRYFMTIPEAAELVIQAGAMGKGGDVFVLDMGEPVKIYELAKKLIGLSGMELKTSDNPDGDIEIKFTGLRAGEKLYEELLIGDNVSSTDHERILKAREQHLSEKEIYSFLREIEEAETTGDIKALKEIFKNAIVGFTPDKEIVDVIHVQKNS